MHRMKLFIYSALLLTALSITTSANAFENQLKVGVGPFTIKDSEPGFSASLNPIGTYIGWVGIFTPNIAMEVRLGGTGKESNPNISLQGTFLSVLFKPTLPIGDSFELYGLGGFSSVAIERTLPGFVAETAGRVGFSYGVGADFRITQHLLAGAEWTSYIQNVDYGATGLNIRMSLSGATANVKYEF